jgi:hypothetical protein
LSAAAQEHVKAKSKYRSDSDAESRGGGEAAPTTAGVPAVISNKIRDCCGQNINGDGHSMEIDHVSGVQQGAIARYSTIGLQWRTLYASECSVPRDCLGSQADRGTLGAHKSGCFQTEISVVGGKSIVDSPRAVYVASTQVGASHKSCLKARTTDQKRDLPLKYGLSDSLLSSIVFTEDGEQSIGSFDNMAQAGCCDINNILKGARIIRENDGTRLVGV